MGLTVSVHGGSNFPGLGPTCLLCVCTHTQVESQCEVV